MSMSDMIYSIPRKAVNAPLHCSETLFDMSKHKVSEYSKKIFALIALGLTSSALIYYSLNRN